VAINSFNNDNFLSIARQRIAKTSSIHKFGRNPNIGNTPETVWM
jgi:hypothetical protein